MVQQLHPRESATLSSAETLPSNRIKTTYEVNK